MPTEATEDMMRMTRLVSPRTLCSNTAYTMNDMIPVCVATTTICTMRWATTTSSRVIPANDSRYVLMNYLEFFTKEMFCIHHKTISWLLGLCRFAASFFLQKIKLDLQFWKELILTSNRHTQLWLSVTTSCNFFPVNSGTEFSSLKILFAIATYIFQRSFAGFKPEYQGLRYPSTCIKMIYMRSHLFGKIFSQIIYFTHITLELYFLFCYYYYVHTCTYFK